MNKLLIAIATVTALFVAPTLATAACTTTVKCIAESAEHVGGKHTEASEGVNHVEGTNHTEGASTQNSKETHSGTHR